MVATLALSHRQLAPTALEAALARDSGRRLSPYARRGKSLSVRVLEEHGPHPKFLVKGQPALPVS